MVCEIFDGWTTDYIWGHTEEPELCTCIDKYWYQYQCSDKLYSNITRVILILYLRRTFTSQKFYLQTVETGNYSTKKISVCIAIFHIIILQ